MARSSWGLARMRLRLSLPFPDPSSTGATVAIRAALDPDRERPGAGRERERGPLPVHVAAQVLVGAERVRGRLATGGDVGGAHLRRAARDAKAWRRRRGPR